MESQPGGAAHGLVCHGCGGAGEGARLGDRCPLDGLALVPEDEHRRGRADPFLGRVLAGKHPVVGRLGVGGVGAVHLGPCRSRWAGLLTSDEQANRRGER